MKYRVTNPENIQITFLSKHQSSYIYSLTSLILTLKAEACKRRYFANKPTDLGIDTIIEAEEWN